MINSKVNIVPTCESHQSAQPNCESHQSAQPTCFILLTIAASLYLLISPIFVAVQASTEVRYWEELNNQHWQQWDAIIADRQGQIDNGFYL